MAAKTKDVVSEATAAVNATAEKVKRANPLTNENQTQVDKARFCIKTLDGSVEDQFTDSPHVAFAARSDQTKVIDHHNGNREYDGTNPGAEKAAKKS